MISVWLLSDKIIRSHEEIKRIFLVGNGPIRCWRIMCCGKEESGELFKM